MPAGRPLHAAAPFSRALLFELNSLSADAALLWPEPECAAKIPVSIIGY